MKLTFFGVRGSCPCSSDEHRRYGGNTSCVLVEVGDDPPLILDLGTGLRALGQSFEDRLRSTGGPLRATAFLSHLHYDHILGLPFFAPLRDTRFALDVYGPSQEDVPLGDVLARAVRPPFFPIHMGEFVGGLRFHELHGAEELRVGSATVRVRTVPHRGATLGIRVEADGRSVAYLPDHQAPPDLTSIDARVLELCESVDLAVLDAQFTDAEFRAMPDWGHSTVAYAVHVAVEAGARRLALFHHDPSHTDKEIDRMLSWARREAARRHLDHVTAASEGVTVDLGRT